MKRRCAARRLVLDRGFLRASHRASLPRARHHWKDICQPCCAQQNQRRCAGVLRRCAQHGISSGSKISRKDGVSRRVVLHDLAPSARWASRRRRLTAASLIYVCRRRQWWACLRRALGIWRCAPATSWRLAQGILPGARASFENINRRLRASRISLAHSVITLFSPRIAPARCLRVSCLSRKRRRGAATCLRQTRVISTAARWLSLALVSISTAAARLLLAHVVWHGSHALVRSV